MCKISVFFSSVTSIATHIGFINCLENLEIQSKDLFFSHKCVILVENYIWFFILLPTMG